MDDSIKRCAIRAVNPGGVSQGGHYSSAMVAGDFVFLSCQTPRDAQRNVIGVSIEDQARATLDNVARVLAAAGARLEDISSRSPFI